MAAVSTKTALADMFKNRFLGKPLQNYTFRPTKFGDLVNKVDDLYGDNLIYPFDYGYNHGTGYGLSATVPVAAAGSFKKWTIPVEVTPYYGRLTLDIPSMKRASRDVGSYLRLKEKETRGILGRMRQQRLGVEVWGDGSNAIGRVSALGGTPANRTVTLTSRYDAVKFDGATGPGSSTGKMKIVFNPTKTGTVGNQRADEYRVDGVERNTSTGTCVITATRVAGAADDVAVNDYIYPQGAVSGATNFYDAGLKGVDAWITSVKPGTGAVPATLYGMDRTDEPEMKAGWRGVDQGSIMDSAECLVSDVMSQYMDPEFSALWLNTGNWYRLKQELTADGRFFEDQEKSMKWGTKVLKMITPAGDVAVACDPYAPSDTGFILDHSTWEINTTGELIHLAEEDLEALRLSDADGLEIRYRSMAVMRCKEPWKNGRFPIS